MKQILFFIVLISLASCRKSKDLIPDKCLALAQYTQLLPSNFINEVVDIPHNGLNLPIKKGDTFKMSHFVSGYWNFDFENAGSAGYYNENTGANPPWTEWYEFNYFGTINENEGWDKAKIKQVSGFMEIRLITETDSTTIYIVEPGLKECLENWLENPK